MAVCRRPSLLNDTGARYAIFCGASPARQPPFESAAGERQESSNVMQRTARNESELVCTSFHSKPPVTQSDVSIEHHPRDSRWQQAAPYNRAPGVRIRYQCEVEKKFVLIRMSQGQDRR